jgi:hypothetical protein
MNDGEECSSASALVLNLPASVDLESVIADLLAWARSSGLSVTEAEERLARAWIEEIYAVCARTDDAPVLNRVLALALKMFVVDSRLLLTSQQTEQRFPRETAGVRG